MSLPCFTFPHSSSDESNKDESDAASQEKQAPEKRDDAEEGTLSIKLDELHVSGNKENSNQSPGKGESKQDEIPDPAEDSPEK